MACLARLESRTNLLWGSVVIYKCSVYIHLCFSPAFTCTLTSSSSFSEK
ncbi:hypothetical protein NC653_002250 [Populus alba x Populus x berolinensis]|uniref:Uncharacterized protein n=1 Tax=Populus alba x Populus x berolinensis TaxID=444605 RepID=A0AAD6RN71_9ROSI|nr:hypothetical protein NC653_002250 [Populus alba x Populus x berolinensis]